MTQKQVHRRLSTEQARVILESYQTKEISQERACELLGVKRARFFRIASEYRNDPVGFTLKHRGNPGNRRISHEAESALLEELKKEKELIEDRSIPISSYNYSAVRDALGEKGVHVSVQTVINRAKEHGFHIGKKVKQVHDREVLTSMPGELLQHDSSIHRWSPYADRKWYLITTIDDFSRRILYADFVERESSFAHIEALKSVFLTYGVPMKYYADQHAIFRYVKDRDKQSPLVSYTTFTDDVDTQWGTVLRSCEVEPVYALSPQAKGKVERPYRWLQDRVVRKAAKEGTDSFERVREILFEIVETYNTRWVHSVTKEIPVLRFERSVDECRTLFRPFVLKERETVEDVFSLKVDRVVDAYRRVSLHGCELAVPHGVPRDTVTLKMTPVREQNLVRIRFWVEDEFLGEVFEQSEKLPGVYF